MKEYVVVSFRKRNCDFATRLISHEALNDEGGRIEDFFEPGCTEIKEVSSIQVCGDIDCLDELYISE